MRHHLCAGRYAELPGPKVGWRRVAAELTSQSGKVIAVVHTFKVGTYVARNQTRRNKSNTDLEKEKRLIT